MKSEKFKMENEELKSENEFVKVKLGDVATVYNGSTPDTKQKEYFDGDIIWITPKDISEQKTKYITQGERNISLKGYQSCSTTMVPKGTVLLTSRAPIGLVAIADTELCTNQGFKNIVTDEEKLHNEYLYYILKISTEFLNSLGSGTTFNEISSNVLKNINFKIHKSVETQKKIARVLSVIDEKIEVNKKINEKLEEMARDLYEYYFVQFDFPNEDGKPYKSSGGEMVYSKELKREIPKGWEVVSLKDLVEIKTGKKDANFAKLNGRYHFFTCSENILKCDEYEFDAKAILIAGNGNFNVKYYEGKFNAYQRTYVLIPKDDKYFYFIYLITSKYIESFKNSSKGSIVKFIRKEDIENIKIVISKNQDEIYNTFNNTAKFLQENQLQIQKLEDLRNFLLPMLLNGQVEVKD